jgi:hypothetical protein
LTYPDLDFCPGSISMTLLGAINTNRFTELWLCR